MKRLVPVLVGTLAVAAAVFTGASAKAGAAPVAPTFAKDVAPIDRKSVV